MMAVKSVLRVEGQGAPPTRYAVVEVGDPGVKVTAQRLDAAQCRAFAQRLEDIADWIDQEEPT